MALFSKNYLSYVVSQGEPFTIDALDRSFGMRKIRVLSVASGDGTNPLGTLELGLNGTGVQIGSTNAGSVTINGSLVTSGASRTQSLVKTANATIAVKTCVYFAANNKFGVASATDLTKLPVGVTVAGAASGAACTAVTSGVAAGVLTSATAGAPYYLSTTGTLTATPPAATGNADIIMGYAMNATDLWVQIAPAPVAHA